MDCDTHTQNWMNPPTANAALLEEPFDNLRLGVVAVVFGHGGAEFAELSEEAVFVLGVTQLVGQAAALDCGRSRAGEGTGATGLRC